MKFKKLKHINTPGCAHELTFSCYKDQDFLADEQICSWVVQNLDVCRNRGLFRLLSYVLMPDHVHLLIMPQGDDYSISKILAAIKIPMTRKLLSCKDDFANDLTPKMLDQTLEKGTHRLWQRGGGYDRNLYSREAIIDSMNYMHENPVRKGLARAPEEWKWSSAGYYTGRKDYVLRMDDDLLGMLV